MRQSANFLTSNYIFHDEVPRILDHGRSQGLNIVPVVAKPCDWQAHPWLSVLNARPKNGTPVWRDHGAHVDQELTYIVQESRMISARPLSTWRRPIT